MKKIIVLFSLLASFALADEVLQGVPFTLTASADGTQPFTYVWSKGGVVVPSYTSAVINVPAATQDMAGVYTVRISNSAGAVVVPFSITVKAPAPVVVPPSNGKVTFKQQVIAWLEQHFGKRS